MHDLIIAAKEFQTYLRKQQWSFCFIGGLAVLRWGEGRLTVDADATLLTGFGNEELFVARILERYASRIPDAFDFALQKRVLLLYLDNGISCDVALGGLPFEEKMIERASDHEYEVGIRLITCSAEDLIVMKAFANRAIDWHDVRVIIIRQCKSMDWKLIINELTPLAVLKEDVTIVPRLLALRDAVGASA